MFVLQRPLVPNTGWSMPEPAPDPDGEKLVDSAVIQDYDRLPGLYNIERDDPAETAPPEPPPAAESPVPPSDATRCYEMLHDLPNCDEVAPATCDPAPAPGLRSCPVPPAVLQARNSHAQYLETLDMIRSVDEALHPESANETEEILT